MSSVDSSTLHEVVMGENHILVIKQPTSTVIGRTSLRPFLVLLAAPSGSKEWDCDFATMDVAVTHAEALAAAFGSDGEPEELIAAHGITASLAESGL